jgi:release factor glutamine methyltransferase
VNGLATPTWADLYQVAAGRLGNGREARWMVEEASGQAWAEVAVAARPAPEMARRRLLRMLDRRQAGEPLQYVLGRWAFRQLDLMVDPRVLIPRPETEQVVEVALAEISRLAAVGGSPTATIKPTNLVVVDLGTGSGAIALSIASEQQRVDVWATDSSPAAVAVARANLAGMGGYAATRVRVVEGDWWSALPEQLRGTIDLVVSNPPYISSAEMTALDPEVREWEPGAALEAGPTGLEAVESILGPARGWLRPNGVAVIEIAPHLAPAAERAARRSGFTDVHVGPDLAGRDRVLVARRAA